MDCDIICRLDTGTICHITVDHDIISRSGTGTIYYIIVDQAQVPSMMS
jgi:hypothetical protein